MAPFLQQPSMNFVPADHLVRLVSVGLCAVMAAKKFAKNASPARDDGIAIIGARDDLRLAGTQPKTVHVHSAPCTTTLNASQECECRPRNGSPDPSFSHTVPPTGTSLSPSGPSEIVQLRALSPRFDHARSRSLTFEYQPHRSCLAFSTSFTERSPGKWTLHRCDAQSVLGLAASRWPRASIEPISFSRHGQLSKIRYVMNLSEYVIDQESREMASILRELAQIVSVTRRRYRNLSV